MTPDPSATTNRSLTQSASHADFIDPAAIMRIKNLQLRAKTIVEGFYNGLHRSPFHGFSAEFSEYRAYAPGDDPRYLDWKLFARSDRYYIKRFEDETNRRCYLIVDFSRSMGYDSVGYSKAEYARTLAATIAYYLSLQRDSVGLFTFDEKVNDVLPARARAGHLHRVLGCLERSLAGRGTDLSQPLEQVAEQVRKRGLIILISDLMAPLDSVQRNLSYLRSRGHEVLLLRTLDPTEVNFSLPNAATVTDLETGRELYVDPVAAEQEYRRRFGEHESQIKLWCTELGIDFSLITTDRPLELALFDLLTAQLRRGRRTRRVTGTRASSSGGAA
ncbi:MAG: DUF58 domain-containing protein [Planctomycetales bacterium]|nr:DUF58 domain-containing protein [Planctomycetales bacterium]